MSSAEEPSQGREATGDRIVEARCRKEGRKDCPSGPTGWCVCSVLPVHSYFNDLTSAPGKLMEQILLEVP